MSYVSVDVDIDDVLWNMSKNEKQQLVDDLYDDGYIPKPLINNHTDNFSKACQKLTGQAWRLSREEEEFIINISKRF